MDRPVCFWEAGCFGRFRTCLHTPLPAKCLYPEPSGLMVTMVRLYRGPPVPGARLWAFSSFCTACPSNSWSRRCDKTQARGPRSTCPGSHLRLHTAESSTPHAPEGGNLVQAKPRVSSLPLWTYLHRDGQEGHRCWRPAFCGPTPSPGLFPHRQHFRNCCAV